MYRGRAGRRARAPEFGQVALEQASEPCLNAYSNAAQGEQNAP